MDKKSEEGFGYRDSLGIVLVVIDGEEVAMGGVLVKDYKWHHEVMEGLEKGVKGLECVCLVFNGKPTELGIQFTLHFNQSSSPTINVTHPFYSAVFSVESSLFSPVGVEIDMVRVTAHDKGIGFNNNNHDNNDNDNDSQVT